MRDFDGLFGRLEYAFVVMKISEERCWDNPFIEELLKAYPAKFGFITASADKFRLQVLLSEVTDDQNPRFVRYGYRLDNEYFYPASSIKLCVAAAIPQKFRALQHSLGGRVTGTTPMSFYPILEDNNVRNLDCPNGRTEMTTVAHEIRKLFLVSDNTAFDRLYALVGHRSLNQAMWSLGLQSTRIFHRFSIHLSSEQNRTCEPLWLDLNGFPAVLPPKKSKLPIPDAVASHGMHVGDAYIAENGKLIKEPMDFSEKNCMNLLDLQNLLVKLVRYDIELEGRPIEIEEGFRAMLKEAMCQYPKDSCNPKFLESEYPDDYCKFFLPGLSHVRPKGSLRVYNKVGRAYGFSVDNAYIFEIETGRCFFLSAVIYTNANGVLNDDIYDYEVADRVMADLAEVVARTLWKIPGNTFASSYYDCVSSSLWTAWESPLFSSVTSVESSQLHHAEDPTHPVDEPSKKVRENDALKVQGSPNSVPLVNLLDRSMEDCVTDSCKLTDHTTTKIDEESVKHLYFIDE